MMKGNRRKIRKEFKRHMGFSKRFDIYIYIYIYIKLEIWKKRHNGTEAIFGEKIFENFSKIDKRCKNTDLRNSGNSHGVNKRKTIPRNITIKLLKNKTEVLNLTRKIKGSL